jgi:glycosyltransferase involved in cell wall biosynthesis
MKILAWPAYSYEPFNPYNWLLNKSLEKLDIKIIPYSLKSVLMSSYDIWHMHWPAENVIKKSCFKTIYRFIGFIFLIVISKLKGAKIVWTAHNYKLHDELHPFIEKLFWYIFIRFVDCYICHSKYAMAKVKDAHPHLALKQGYVIYHGHYRDWYKNDISRSKARSGFEIDPEDFVYLFIGSIRPYKNIETLIKVFNQREGPNEKLIIAGNVNDVFWEKIVQKIDNNDRIIFHNGWVSDDDFQKYFKASDLVILPYKILNSGMALLSLSFNCRLMMPINPMLSEYQEYIGSENIYLYKNKIDNNKIDLAKNTIVSLPQSNKVIDLQNFEWRTIAQKTLEVYREVNAK